MRVILKDGSVYAPPEKKKRVTRDELTKPKGKSRTLVITDAKIPGLIEQAKKLGKPIEFTHVRMPGMKLICYPSGKAMWRHRYRDANSQKQIITIGSAITCTQ